MRTFENQHVSFMVMAIVKADGQRDDDTKKIETGYGRTLEEMVYEEVIGIHQNEPIIMAHAMNCAMQKVLEACRAIYNNYELRGFLKARNGLIVDIQIKKDGSGKETKETVVEATLMPQIKGATKDDDLRQMIFCQLNQSEGQLERAHRLLEEWISYCNFRPQSWFKDTTLIGPNAYCDLKAIMNTGPDTTTQIHVRIPIKAE